MMGYSSGYSRHNQMGPVVQIGWPYLLGEHMQKSCRWCGKIVSRDHNCMKRPKTIAKRTAEESGRYTTEWKNKSVEIKELSNYLCAVCADADRYIYDGLEVHHIIPLRERPDLLLEDSNLICLCERHHTQAERGEIKQDVLRQLVKHRDTPGGVFV